MKSLRTFIMESLQDETINQFNTDTISTWSPETFEAFLEYFDNEESAKTFYESCAPEVQKAIDEGVRDKAKKIGNKAWEFVKKTTGEDQHNI